MTEAQASVMRAVLQSRRTLGYFASLQNGSQIHPDEHERAAECEKLMERVELWLTAHFARGEPTTANARDVDKPSTGP